MQSGKVLKKTIVIISSVLVVALVAGSVWAIVSGRLHVAWTEQDGAIRTAPQVCTSDIVERYNQLFDTADREEYERNYDELAERVRTSEADTDPTCQFIAFRYYIERDFDVDAAQQHLDRLSELVDEGLYPSLELTSIQSITSLHQLLDDIRQADEEFDPETVPMPEEGEDIDGMG